MTTLASAALDLARILCDVFEGEATGGNATTLSDTGVTEEDDYFNGGTIWSLSGNNAGKSRVITDWTKSTGTFTFATMTALNAAADKYAACNSDIPRRALWQSINKALVSIGGIPALDTSLVTVANQEAYTLPAGVIDVRKVEIALMTASPYQYVSHYGWRQVGTTIMFDPERTWDVADYKIRLTHIARPTRLTADTDTISDYIHPDRLAWKAAVHARRWQIEQYREDRPDLVKLLNEALQQEAAMDIRYPIPEIQRDPHLGGYAEVPFV